MSEEQPDTVEEVKSIDEAMEAAMREQEVEEETAEEPSEEVAEEENTEEEVEEDANSSTQEDETVEPTEETVEDDNKEEAEEVEVPAHWANEDKEALKGIKDAEARKLVIRINDRFREAHQRKQNELNEQYAPVKEELTPYRQLMQQQNMNETQFLQKLVQERTQFERLFATDPQQVIADLARNSGLEIYFGDGTEASQYTMSPDKQRILQQDRQLESYQRQNTSSAEQQVLNWASETDESGQLKRPHFEKVGTQMMALMQAAQTQGQTLSLDDAYKQAVRADDDLYEQDVQSKIDQKLVTQQQSQDEARRVQMEKARKGSKRLSGRAPAKSVRKAKTIDDAIDMAMESQRNSA